MELIYNNGFCTITENHVIIPITPLVITGGAYDTSFPGLSDGSVYAYTISGAGGETYSWVNVATGAVVGTTATVFNLPAGNYTVTVTDANGCQQSISVSINDPIVYPPGNILVENIGICLDLDSGNFQFTDNQDYTGSSFTTLPYRIAVTVTLKSSGIVTYSGSLSSPDILSDSELAANRTYLYTQNLGENFSIPIPVDINGNYVSDIYQITWTWNFTGGTSAENSMTVEINNEAYFGYNIATLGNFTLIPVITENCSEATIVSVDTTDYDIPGAESVGFHRVHKLFPPPSSGLANPVDTTPNDTITLLELYTGVWNTEITSNITWYFPVSGVDTAPYCIIKLATGVVSNNVECVIDPCEIHNCINTIQENLNRAECDRNINDIKKYREELNKVSTLLTLYEASITCEEGFDSTILNTLAAISDCECN